MRAGVRLGPFWVSSGGRRRRHVTAGAVTGTVCVIAVLDAVTSGGWWVVAGWTAVGLFVLGWLAWLTGRNPGQRASGEKAAEPAPRSPRMYHSGRR